MNQRLRCKTFLKKQKEEKNLWNLKLSEEFLHLTPKALCIKGKVNKFELMKIKNFCSVKESSKKIIEIFANHISNKRLVSRIY